MRSTHITQKRIREMLEYRNGRLYWKILTTRPQQKIGDRAGSPMSDKFYRVIGLDGNYYLEHRIVWIYHNGMINRRTKLDHINRKKMDNRIENLRKANQSQNTQNIIKPKNNTSGYKGVSFRKKEKLWEARIACKGVTYRLGLFHLIKDAVLAYNKAAKKFHGKFACLNKIKYQ